MSAEDAISLIERLKAEIDWWDCLEYETALNEAIKALRKDIPMEARRAEGTVIKYYKCPMCKAIAEIRPDGYCFKCGQRLKIDNEHE